MATSARDAFVNCPFDQEYQTFFRAIAFVIIRSGFRARCALETDDSSVNRFEKICAIRRECRRKMTKICEARGLEPDELTFADYAEMVAEYLAATG